MVFLIVLVVMYVATWLIPPRSRWTQQARWRVALALGMAFAGISHLVMPTPFLQHLPEWAPMRSAVVFASGLVEIAFGVAAAAAHLLAAPDRARVGGLPGGGVSRQHLRRGRRHRRPGTTRRHLRLDPAAVPAPVHLAGPVDDRGTHTTRDA